MWIVLIILALICGVISLVVAINAKREERDKYYAAARNILKDKYLRMSLENPLRTDDVPETTTEQKLMVYIKTVGMKPRKRYVFNPEQEIPFGRRRDESGVFLNEAIVSQHHCRIILYDGNVWLEDLGSSNGTGLQRGLFGNYRLMGGQHAILRSGDVLIIGSAKMKIKLFVFDTVFM